MSKQDQTSYEFGPFRLDARERRLIREGKAIPLAPKVFDTLVALVEGGGRLIDKDELMMRLWPDTFVEEGTLARNISDLRKALGESSGSGKYIETVPKRGYRFVTDVRELTGTTLIVQRQTRSRVIVEEEIEPADGLRSIAVLPFKSLSADEADEYLGLGIADALITRLTKIRRMMVRPTSAVFKYAGLRQDPVLAGRELNVASVLDGSIQRWNDRIRITVQLVSVKDASALWAEKFDEKFTDIFAVEDSISQQVATALTLTLTGDERRLLGRHYTENTEAYQSYLKGRYFWNRRSTESLKKGVEYFTQAIDLDPSYASAYAGVSDSYTLLVVREALPPQEGFAKAKAAAAMALRIDEEFAEAHASLGHALLHNWEWDDAEREIKRAIELNPGYPSAHHWYSEHLTARGRCDESITELALAAELDPLSLVISADLGRAFYYARNYDQVIMQEARTLELDSNFWLSHINLGRSYTQKGMHAEAINELQKACELSVGNTEALSFLGFAYAAAGNRGQALEMLVELSELSKHSHVPPYHFAIVYAGLGDNDRAFEWLERSFEKHAVDLFTLRVEPMFDGLRSDPRFEDLQFRVGLA
ncbi:MAG TPA: winged helix-turn-helix domain-containing protein [Blastocatellia bacterium]|nr:winged helix-turn-helix domain-containing protein [Blastocatellia bacterium]